jgi:hypothetical protein
MQMITIIGLDIAKSAPSRVARKRKSLARNNKRQPLRFIIKTGYIERHRDVAPSLKKTSRKNQLSRARSSGGRA